MGAARPGRIPVRQRPPRPVPGARAPGAVQLPDFPVPAVPDVTSLTKQASQTESAIKATTPLPQGLSVTGARCNSSGTVVNRGGVTSLDGDGGGAVVSGSGTKLRNKDGSGTFTDGGRDLLGRQGRFGRGDLRVGHAAGGRRRLRSIPGRQRHLPGRRRRVRAVRDRERDLPGRRRRVRRSGRRPTDHVSNDGDGSGVWVSKLGTVTVNGDGTGDPEHRRPQDRGHAEVRVARQAAQAHDPAARWAGPAAR